MVGFWISGTRFSLSSSLSQRVAADDLPTRGGCHFCNVTAQPHWPAGSSWQWWWHPAREGTTNAMKLNCAEGLLLCWTIGSDWFFARILIPIGFMCSNCQLSDEASNCGMLITFLANQVSESVSDVLISIAKIQRDGGCSMQCTPAKQVWLRSFALLRSTWANNLGATGQSPWPLH